MRVLRRVRLFSSARIEDDAGVRRPELSDKALALLGYLIRQRDAVSRVSLATLFWGDTSDYRSRRNLTRALSQITAELPGCLRADHQRVQWASSEQVWVDVQACDQLLGAVAPRGDGAHDLGANCERLEQAVALYSGELLADLNLDDCPEFETWLVRERERWQQQITGAVATLIGHHSAHGRLDAAERYARFWLDLEPWQEEAHRALMLLLSRSGRRGEALAQYEICVRALEAELGIGPSEETAGIYERIKADGLERAANLARPGAHIYELVAARPPARAAPPAPRAWSAIPAHGPCFGREGDLATLERLVLDEGCRVVVVAGVGGVGKTTLVARLANAIAAQADIVLWRSLAGASRPEALVAGLIAALAEHPPALEDLEAQLAQLLDLLRGRRCLIVLDGWELLLRPGAHAGEYLEGYEGYGRLLYALGAHDHQSCLLLTTRELPWGFNLLRASAAHVRTLMLAGLHLAPSRQILRAAGIADQPGADEELTRRCAGNPLALSLVAETVRDLFDGQLAQFLRECALIFEHTRAVVEQQWLRLSDLEQEILTWLAAMGGAMHSGEIQRQLGDAAWADVIEGLRSLQRRSLIHQSHAGFVLDQLMAEYIGELLADRAHRGRRGRAR